MTISAVSDSLKRFARDDCGATAIEYALIAGGISIAIVAVVYTLGDSVVGRFQDVADSF